MYRFQKTTHIFNCPNCHNVEITISDGEQVECPSCKAKMRYKWKPPCSLIDAAEPLFDAEIEIDNKWVPFLLPPIISERKKNQSIFE